MLGKNQFYNLLVVYSQLYKFGVHGKTPKMSTVNGKYHLNNDTSSKNNSVKS